MAPFVEVVPRTGRLGKSPVRENARVAKPQVGKAGLVGKMPGGICVLSIGALPGVR